MLCEINVKANLEEKLPVGHDDIVDRTFDRFRQIMQDPVRRPALVHCASANRVGCDVDAMVEALEQGESLVR